MILNRWCGQLGLGEWVLMLLFWATFLGLVVWALSRLFGPVQVNGVVLEDADALDERQAREQIDLAEHRSRALREDPIAIAPQQDRQTH